MISVLVAILVVGVMLLARQHVRADGGAGEEHPQRSCRHRAGALDSLAVLRPEPRAAGSNLLT